MAVTAFLNGTAVLPDRLWKESVVVCEDDRIRSIGAIRSGDFDTLVDLEGGYLVPGFVDLHVHGGAGADFMDGTVDACRTAANSHLQHGTTAIFPTSTTGDEASITTMLTACRTVQTDGTAPNIQGVHLYGPYFAPEKVGCHSREGCRPPMPEEYERYLNDDLVRIATCAAELDGAEAFYRAAAERGCLVTCGHSNADWNEMSVAFENGMRHVDHFWCAMSSIASLKTRFSMPMRGSMAEFVLMNEMMSTEVIADGWHLAPELLEFAYRMLGPERLCLVTDCNRALDCPPGEYAFGHESGGSRFHSDGEVGWTLDRSALASSVRGMDHMVRRMLSDTTATLPEVIRMATLTPAERMGMSDEFGSLSPGKRADVLILSPDLHVREVYLGGKRQSFDG